MIELIDLSRNFTNGFRTWLKGKRSSFYMQQYHLSISWDNRHNLQIQFPNVPEILSRIDARKCENTQQKLETHYKRDVIISCKTAIKS